MVGFTPVFPTVSIWKRYGLTRMEEIGKALAQPRRLEVLEALLAHPGVTQQELREALGIPSSQRGTLSKDTSALKRAGLIADDETARWRLTLPDLTARALQGLADLDREVAVVRAKLADQRSRRLRKATMRNSPEGSPAADLSSGNSA